MPNIRFASLLAAAALAGCFSPEYPDNPYTHPRGETFNNLQLEISPEGDPHIMTRVAMHYEYEGEDIEQIGTIQTRNYHSVLYRRAKGGWSATPFRNIQTDWSSLPALVRDSEGRLHAFVRDAGRILWYKPDGDGWTRAPAGKLEHAGDYLNSGYRRGADDLAVRDGKSVVFLERDWEHGIRIHGVAGGRGSFILDTSFSTQIHEVWSTPDFMAVLGSRYIREVREGMDYSRPQLVFWRWPHGDTAATPIVLPDTAFTLAKLIRYRESLGIFFILPDGYFVRPLGPDGRPLESIRLAHPGFREPDPDKPGSPGKPGIPGATSWMNMQTEADPRGCVHALSLLSDSDPSTRSRLSYANSCDATGEEEIALDLPGLGADPRILDFHMRVAEDGRAFVALILAPASPRGASGALDPDLPSFLVLAERAGTRWVLDIVEEK